MSASILACGILVPATNAFALWDDRLELFIAETLTRDDNVYCISSDPDPATALGSSSKGDTYSTTSFGFNLGIPVSRQRFVGGLALSKTAWKRFAALDSTGRQQRALWLWRLGRRRDAHRGDA